MMKIWIDLDNTPHVPFFKPIIRELEKRGYTVILTARDAFQVCELATLYGLPYKKFGKHYGKNPLFKIGGLCWRSLLLLPFVIREKPVLALSHGSRAQILLCNLLRIPTVMIMDYEHAQTPLLLKPRWEIIPMALSNERLQCKTKERILSYEGIKEDVYAPEFKPDPMIVSQLNLNGDILVTVRPPANEAHYHNPESDALFIEFMERVCATSGVKAILLPRNKLQETQIKQNWPQWFADSKVIIPKHAVNGLNLLWHSDVVVSGGGTMNREAAALGIPVYSIFRGKSGAVDRQLQNEGRLMLIGNADDVNNKILLQHRSKEAIPSDLNPRKALSMIVDHIGSIMTKEYSDRV
jgi:predicted glycosyltransferase